MRRCYRCGYNLEADFWEVIRDGKVVRVHIGCAIPGERIA